MRKLLALSIAVLFFTLPSFAQRSKFIRVLIVDGFSNHDWKQTTFMIKSILEESKLFRVDVSTAPFTTEDSINKNWRPQFHKYDVVIQNCNNFSNKKIHWPGTVESSLENYVRSGGGLYILHSANNSFPHWAEYDRMMGLGWRSKDTGFAVELDNDLKIIFHPPGTGRNTYHGPRTDMVIRKLSKHPINKDFPDEWKSPNMELYKYVRGPARDLTILSYATDTSTKKNWPVEWVVNYGKGRVYNSTMGHLWKNETYPISYRCVGFQTTVIRVAEWLASGKTTYPLPKEFPSERKMVVREENDIPGK